MYGIDCPELKQDFGNVAKKFTSNLCWSKEVCVDVKYVDQHGRNVGVLWVKDVVNVNLELLKAGLAWHYKHFDKSKEFAKAEAMAKQKKMGIGAIEMLLLHGILGEIKVTALLIVMPP